MTATTASYQSHLPVGRDGFTQLVHAEWTKFRTVRGWVIAAIASALLIVGFAYLATFHHQNGGACVGTSASATSCQTVAQPHVPLGPGGEAVTDTFYFVHRSLTGTGSITARVGSLSGLRQNGSGNSVSHSELAGVPGPLQPWAKAGLIVTASTKPGAAYAAVMLTGGHGVRMQDDYIHDTAGPMSVSAASAHWLRLTRSGSTLTAYASADGTHWTKVSSAHGLGLPTTVQAGLFVTSPQTGPAQQYLSTNNASGQATAATATFDQLTVHGQPAGAWNGQDIGAKTQMPTLTSVGYHRSSGGYTVVGSGDIAPAVGIPSAYTDQTSLTGVFIALIVLIVLATLFITTEYRRGLIHTTLIANPRRSQVLAAKVIVIAAVTFLAGAAASAAAIPIGAHLLRSTGNYVYPTSTLAELRVILGTGALVALAAVIALALGTAFRRSAGAVVAVIVLIILPYMLVIASAVPAGVAQWLMRLTPAAGFAVQQTLPQYHQVNYTYTPANGFYPLSPTAGFAVLCAYALLALGLASYLLRRRDA
jgi:ABC-type transport system involved in multi-copper enzyme maturation permease subunit